MAADEIYGLSENDRSILGQIIGWWRTFRRETQPMMRPPQVVKAAMVCYATSDIDAATGDITSGGGLTPGIGDVQPCYYDLSAAAWVATSDQTVEAHNISSATVTANIPLQAKKINGYWVIDFESCG